jgi:hypothetical protein
VCGDGFVQPGCFGEQCDDGNNPKIMAMPYKQYVAPWAQVRSFAGWTQAHEISMNLNTMNTCNGPVGAYSGRFQFTVF